MANIKQIGMAAGTFSVALGIGFVMQNGDALANRFSNDTVPEQTAPFTEASADVDAALAVQPIPAADEPMNTVLASADESAFEETEIFVAQAGVAVAAAPEIMKPEPVVSAAVILPDDAKVPLVQEVPVQLATLDAETAPIFDADVAPAGEIDCVPTMVATAGAAASVELIITAPCHTDAAFTIHHQGMMFTAMTDGEGQSELSVPALAEVAVMIAAFTDGDGAVGTATIPDFTSYDRAVLQWQGDADVMLSAYEGDANFGDENHIHASNPGDMTRLESAVGGYLVQLGDASVDNGLMAEVYTFPTGMMGDALDVMLVAEAEITATNCGQELNAQSIQVSPTGETSALDLTMIMPECDAVGDFLILQNMFEDLTLASR